MISPNSFCGFILTRAIDMDLDPPILQNPWTKMEKHNLIHHPKGVGCQKVLFKTDLNIFNTFWNIAKNCLTTLSPDNYIETLSTNQKMKWSSGRE